MTSQKFRRILFATVFTYLVAILFAIYLYKTGPKDLKENYNYTVFKDLIPLVVALPIAYLGYCFQRRISFLQSLKQSWSHLNKAVHSAIQYTHKTLPTQVEYGNTLNELEEAIDELRGVYKNAEETNDQIGFYTFESLKTIHEEISKLGFDKTFKLDQTKKTRDTIVENWKTLRKTFLRELNRPEPTYLDSPFVNY